MLDILLLAVDNLIIPTQEIASVDYPRLAYFVLELHI